jgi:multisite-specific tRNA:(cytosine-C5)-methyltransferase
VHSKNDDFPRGIEGGEGASDDDSFEESITLPLWRSLHSLNLMLPKEERRAMLLRIYNEDVELINHTAKNDSSADATPAAAESSEAMDTTEDAKLAGISAEQDSLATEDASLKEKVEVQEDEQNKVDAAMPERAGEEDVSNKTI